MTIHQTGTPRVPFLDLHAATSELRAQIDAGLARVLDSGRYLLGAETEAFEAEFAAFCGAAHCTAVGSGGAALELVLRAWGVGPGDEVVVPSHTFIAPWLAVSAVGAEPVPAEPDPRTGGIDPARVAAALTPRTRVILPVHLHGHPVALRAVAEIARSAGVAVLEDAAQAHGARADGRRIGAAPLPGLVHAAAFSFYPGKNLGSLGDGGAVTTEDPDLAERIRMLRSYGARRKYDHEIAGGNSRIDEFQAAVLRAKLPLLDAWNGRRAAVAERYLRAFAGRADLRLPAPVPGTEPAWHVFAVRHPERDRLAAALAARGVETLVHYPVPVHRSGVYRDRWPQGSLPVAEEFAARLLSLPIGPHLTAEQAAVVEEAVVGADV